MPCPKCDRSLEHVRSWQFTCAECGDTNAPQFIDGLFDEFRSEDKRKYKYKRIRLDVEKVNYLVQSLPLAGAACEAIIEAVDAIESASGSAPESLSEARRRARLTIEEFRRLDPKRLYESRDGAEEFFRRAAD